MFLQEILSEYLYIVVWGFSGIFAGRLVDLICGKIHSRISKSWPSQLVNVLCQLMLVAALPVVLNIFQMKNFVKDWQISIAGLFFAAFYLGMQSSLLTAAQALKIDQNI